MSFNKYFQILSLAVLSAILISSCSGLFSPAADEPLQLAEFTKNSVTVTIYLNPPRDGINSLSASFVPAEGLHLYSKDVPPGGVEGLGRPTLLELTQESKMIAAGELAENIPAQIPDFEPKDLLIYPAGGVILTLPITLPVGKDWVDDEISLTYMACSDTSCKAPVVGYVLSVQIPGNEFDSNQ